MPPHPPHATSSLRTQEPITTDSSLWHETLVPSLRANGSRECAPDDRLREAIQSQECDSGLLRRFAPRKDKSICLWLWVPARASLGRDDSANQ